MKFCGPGLLEINTSEGQWSLLFLSYSSLHCSCLTHSWFPTERSQQCFGLVPMALNFSLEKEENLLALWPGIRRRMGGDEGAWRGEATALGLQTRKAV